MKAKKFVGILLAVSIVVTCSFSVSAVTYEHSLQTTQKYSYAPYLSNKTWSHNFNIEYEHFELPTSPMPSASGISPTFLGLPPPAA